MIAIVLSLMLVHMDGEPNAGWYRGLRSNDGSMSCCNMTDCRETDYRIERGGGVEAMTEAGNWVAVPPDKILRHVDNPTGYAVLCYTPSLGVLCFVMPALS